MKADGETSGPFVLLQVQCRQIGEQAFQTGLVHHLVSYERDRFCKFKQRNYRISGKEARRKPQDVAFA